MVAAVLFSTWLDAAPTQELVLTLSSQAGYVPGEFYKRELPCLLHLIQSLPEIPGTIIVDGYVWLGPDVPGLGARLYEALGHKAAIIGVAKTLFRSQDIACPVFRGGSQRPLYVTAAGIDAQTAVSSIQSMHGEYRIPTLIKRADQLARGHTEAPKLPL